MTITGPIRRSIVSRRKCRQGLRCRARRGRGAAITPRRGRCARCARPDPRARRDHRDRDDLNNRNNNLFLETRKDNLENR